MRKFKNLDINLLECTLRDGSYAIDFKFTLNDTASLARILSLAGFKYIEVGHGVGMGAMRAGKGDAPWSDEDVVRVAKTAVGDASLIGEFFIPGIGSLDDIKKAKDSGLDFIRIGENAPDIAKTIPYIKEAIKRGITPMVNLMKSYVLPPQALGEKIKHIAGEGVRVVCIVDSAGGMVPEQVGAYFQECRRFLPKEVALGFHGHNNLCLAVANCLEAIYNGADFIDTTLYGIGRSAGNAPTEVMVALLKRLGCRMEAFDIFEIMDIVEDYIQPMASKIPMYDMVSVIAGDSFFHSSFLPQVLRVAQKYSVDVKRLIAAIGKADALSCDEDILEKLASDLAKNKKHKRRDFSFVDLESSGMSEHKINNTLEVIESFITELEVIASKTCGVAVLDIMPLGSQEEYAALSEFVLHDNQTVIGRFYYGNMDVLSDILKKARGKIKRIIVDIDTLTWIKPVEFYKILTRIWEKDSISFYSSINIFMNYITNIILNLIKIQKKCLLIYGKDTAIDNMYKKLSLCFEEINFFERPLKKKADVILILSSLPTEDVDLLLKSVNPGGLIIVVGKILNKEISKKAQAKGIRLLSINPFDAYRGLSSQLFTFEREP